MLTQLTVNNFAIVKFLELDLQPGMTCITGETGAGKSIAIDALGLCLGERAEAAMVRPGNDKTEVSARFLLEGNPQARAWLAGNELESEGECIVRRVVSAEGRSRSYVNGVPVPLTQLRSLGQLLVNVHGQHAHQLLVKPDYQLALLDGYAGHHLLLADVRHHYQHWRQLQNELNRLKAEQQQREARRQLIEYQVQELDEFALQSGEFEAIEEEHQRLANGTELMQECGFCLDLLYDNEETTIAGLLQIAVDRAEGLVNMDARLAPVLGMLNEALIGVQESHSELRGYLDKLELDPERFNELEARLSKAINLARKHHVKPAELAHYHQELASDLARLNSDEQRLEGMEAELAEARLAFLQAADALSQSRQRYGAELATQVTASMQELSMTDGRFAIEIKPDANASLSPLGIDRVEFVVSTNPGQPMQPLGKVASGGELSRISLAIVVISARKVATPTLIFDEVDVGISGPTAAVVGRLLRQLGESTQVMVVTHLPQVAGNGHQHMVVSKHTDGKTTETRMSALDNKARLNELARLLGGDQITDNTLANARELLQA
ncbi:DNA repair protein RecN [Aeromonas rivuli]|jgi:DNA repair protein RecN (Recombination protein N)|uniref:DNA repair protein RecN n=1 Tax=Aeromonas TaxID=642 RepID=UPI0005AA48FB|nr:MULTISPECIES: DNA repair protein RecN [Aeromonas]MCS3454537.1 DNA repair protein RecN (Recombination protein N) [Aeromonas sp. BIGb0405]MCS3459465.1 DNA repair protein RecN (Recombination protein N) [Aeromonas sp. BIGb0445]UBO75239.1 DNA repair protein RecN [Aeromonas rivuli]